MNDDRFAELLERLHQGLLSGAELGELRDRISSDETLRREASGDQWVDRLLEYGLSHRADDEDFLNAVRRGLTGPESDERFVAKTLSRVDGRSPARPLLKLGTAAVLLLGLAVLFFTPVRPKPVTPVPGDMQVGETGKTVAVDEGRLTFLAPTLYAVAKTGLRLEAGHVRLDLKAPLTVATPEGSFLNKGTVYEVQLNRAMDRDFLVKRVASGKFKPRLSARVLEGEVEYRRPGGEARTLTPKMGKVPLSDDPSIGRIVDREGNGQVKPVMAGRWSVAEERMALEVGDWLRTGHRGANALVARLAYGSTLTLGPGAQVELTDMGTIRLVTGELEVDTKEPLDVRGPDGKVLKVEGIRVLRARGNEMTALENRPGWLTGYRNNASTEAMGTLLANVDGRDVPLTIGYHKVTVDIRDQIVRTEIEESFVNHTNSVLEGVFHFPLPQDASISGFGMWIGNEYVHADIVEKQRAREIYETILREKRDPGLLEWTGGNIFKARVYPIGSEKRIKISYTQVLPKVGDTCRYVYPLQSEMLRLHPLKELKIEVKIDSAEPLTGLEVTSHPCRIDRTDHNGHVEFEAQEYVPSRDFELRYTVTSKPGALTLVPHRRADDGYFLMAVSLPARQEGGRETVPDSDPLSLVVLADTSGSMMGRAREQQADFIAALLSSLGKKDRFTLATCDTVTRWAFPGPVAATEENVAKAMTFLEKRYPLGWSNLEGAFAEVMGRVRPNDQVIYVGDGAITTGDADPVAFARRLKALYKEEGTFHAVAPGSTYESIVLTALAGLGGGSWRVVEDPARTAHQLLKEIASPGLKGATVAFDGGTTAAVYPETLPNLPAGTQLILLGRYDPTRGDTPITATVRGTLGGRPFETKGTLKLAGAEAGNSFIPRLWARRHLDHLLDQGRSEEIKQRIIALSEAYQIITPYTSFLVLESDADRERFAVKKQFRMRDGEAFFAKGRDNADAELARKQMIKAKRWRRAMRERTIRGIGGMARDLMERFAPPQVSTVWAEQAATRGGIYGYRGGGFNKNADIVFSVTQGDSLNGTFLERSLEADKALRLDSGFSESVAAIPPPDASEPAEGYDAEEAELENLELTFKDDRSYSDFPMTLAATDRLEEKSHLAFDGRFQQNRQRMVHRRGYLGWEGAKRAMAGPVAVGRLFAMDEANNGLLLEERGQYFGYPRYNDPFAGIFPAIPEPTEAPKDPKWDKAILDLLKSLDRRTDVSKLDGGLKIVSTNGKYVSTTLLSKDQWVVTPKPPMGQGFQVTWLLDGRRGAWDAAWQTARTRKAVDGDATAYPAPVQYAFGGILESYGGYTAELKGDTLVLSDPSGSFGQTFVIDRAKRAIVEVRVKNGWTTTFENFVEVAGLQWPTRIVSRNAQGKETGVTTITVEAVAKIQADPMPEGTLELKELPTDLAEARQRAADKKATFEDHWALLRAYAATARWEQAEPHAKAVDGKRLGHARIRMALLGAKRRLEELKAAILVEAKQLAGQERVADHAAAEQLLTIAYALNGGSERKTVVEALKPLYERRDQQKAWDNHLLQCLRRMNRPEAVHAHLEAMAKRWAKDLYIQIQFAQSTARHGKIDDALAYLKFVEQGEWTKEQVNQLRSTAGDILLNAYRLEDFLAAVDGWKESASADTFNKYLSALIMLDRPDEAEKRIRAWIELDEGPRLIAAIQHALGNGYTLNRYGRYDDRYGEPLVKTALRLADDEKLHSWTTTILQNYHFKQSDAGRKVLKDLYDQVKGAVATMEVAPLARRILWLKNGYSPEEGYAPLLTAVFERWEKAEGADKAALKQIILTHGSNTLKIRIHRTDEDREELFALLLQEKWTPEIEAELITLIEEIFDFHRFADWLVPARAQATVAAIPDVNTLPRRKLREAQVKALKEAREAAIARLADLKIEKVQDWIVAERLYLQAKLGQDAAKIRTEATALLKKAVDVKKPVLAARMVGTLMFVSLKDPAGPADLEKFLRDAKGDLLDWKSLLYTLLVAHDRGDDVEALLAKWFGAGDRHALLRWGREYGMILAERDQIDKAVEAFEKVRKLDGLGYEDLRTLSDWYLVQAKRARWREARIASWEHLGENALQNTIYRESQRYSRSGPGVPSEVDSELPLKLIALFRKAHHPGNYIWTLHNVYGATRDFRLLECVPEAVIGHSSQRIYPFLQQLTQITNLLQEEATLDRLSAHLQELHGEAKTDVDRRALRLLEFMVEHRASEQIQGADPHEAKALRALREAFKGAWEENEPERMASFLDSRGRLQPKSLSDEQLRQLKALTDMTEAGTWSRLVVAGHYASRLTHASQREEGVHVLTGAIDAFRKAHEGVIPTSANPYLSQLVGCHQGLHNGASAERVWLSELTLDHPPGQILWLKEQLYSHYAWALRAKAEVSIGRGEELYHAVHDLLLGDLKTVTNENHMVQVVNTLCGIFATAGESLHYPTVKADLKRFGFVHLGPILEQYRYRNGQNAVSTVAERMRRQLDKPTLVEFLVIRAESEPAWLRIQGSDFWSQHAYQLARARAEAKALAPAIEARVLAIVLKELRIDLESRQARNRIMYDDDNSHFWAAKREDFMRVAMEVLEKRRRFEASVLHIAHYLFYDLSKFNEAVAALAAAHEAGILGLDGQTTLVQYLQGRGRWAESIPHLVRLVEKRPDTLDLRVMLMRGYFHLKNRELLVATREAAEKRFRDQKSWHERVIATLGAICVETKLHEDAIRYYDETIALHVKTHPNRGVGNGTLSTYYRTVAEAHSGLGRTDKAVDAAAGAIISWGRNLRGRRQALDELKQILARAKDLEEYVTRLDKTVKETGLENPVVRKALGEVYLDRKDFEKAIVQLRLAVEQQPNDVETHRLLVRALDGAGRKAEATAQLRASAELSGHDLEIYRDLGDRFKAMEDAGEAERAYSTMAEMLPNESEGHAAWAAVLEKQSRLDDAAVQWRQAIRVRTKEPAGWIGLGKVLVRQKNWDGVREVVEKLRRTEWPTRFGNVGGEARQLERSIPK